jgi:hypothetical protein
MLYLQGARLCDRDDIHPFDESAILWSQDEIMSNSAHTETDHWQLCQPTHFERLARRVWHFKGFFPGRLI